jgi:hypothetical protein
MTSRIDKTSGTQGTTVRLVAQVQSERLDELVVQRLSLLSGQLEDSATGGSEGGSPLRGTVSASRLHRHESEPAGPGGDASAYRIALRNCYGER